MDKNPFKSKKIELAKGYTTNCSQSNKEISHKNGISLGRVNLENCNSQQERTQLQKNTLLKDEHDKVDHKPAEKCGDREMPRLTKETDSGSKSSQLINSSIINQRYQNVLHFPNFRQRKKFAFEKKLRRCGVELDGETTISNIRKILQPLIYQEINKILDKYIEDYFKKAFKHIRENVNLSSEHWLQTLKCSISKSLYKQYCDNANVDPFDSVSITDDDFSYFKSSQKINHRAEDISSFATDNSVKSEIDNSTGHTSDTNSQCSHLSSTVQEKIEIDTHLNRAETSCRLIHLNGHSKNHVSRKRNNQMVNRLCSKMPQNHSELNDGACSHRKYRKIVYPTQSQKTDPYPSHCSNTSSSFILKELHRQEEPETARFENGNQSYFSIRQTSEQSSSAIDPDTYLKTQTSMTTTSNGDYHCS